jgi:hypothetical protein
MEIPLTKLTTISLGSMFLRASARYEQDQQIAEAAWEMLFDDHAILPDDPLPELVDYLVARAAMSGRHKAA